MADEGVKETLEGRAQHQSDLNLEQTYLVWPKFKSRTDLLKFCKPLIARSGNRIPAAGCAIF